MYEPATHITFDSPRPFDTDILHSMHNKNKKSIFFSFLLSQTKYEVVCEWFDIKLKWKIIGICATSGNTYEWTEHSSMIYFIWEAALQINEIK